MEDNKLNNLLNLIENIHDLHIFQHISHDDFVYMLKNIRYGKILDIKNRLSDIIIRLENVIEYVDKCLEDLS